MLRSSCSAIVSVACLVGCLIAPSAGAKPRQKAVGGSFPYSAIVYEVAERQGVDPLLIRAIIQVESAFIARVRSPHGAMGLMQISPKVAARYAVRDPYDPAANIEAGILHLKWLLSKFELPVALAAYNAGDGAVAQWGGRVPPYRETRRFVQQVLRLAQR